MAGSGSAVPRSNCGSFTISVFQPRWTSTPEKGADPAILPTSRYSSAEYAGRAVRGDRPVRLPGGNLHRRSPVLDRGGAWHGSRARPSRLSRPPSRGPAPRPVFFVTKDRDAVANRDRPPGEGQPVATVLLLRYHRQHEQHQDASQRSASWWVNIVPYLLLLIRGASL